MRPFVTRPLFGLFAAASVALVGGCESSSPPSVDSSMTETTVKGVAKVNGVPLTEGELIFDPANNVRKVASVVAPIGKDGSFTVKTLTGQNQVKLGGAAAKAHRIAGRGSKPVEVKGNDTIDLDFTESK